MRETRSEKPMGFCSSQPPLSFWKAVACSTALKGALQRQSHHARILHEVRHLCLFDCSLQVSAAIVKEFVPIWSGSSGADHLERIILSRFGLQTAEIGHHHGIGNSWIFFMEGSLRSARTTNF